MTVFVVDGHSWLPGSWASTVTLGEEGKETGAPQYAAGTVLSFDARGNAGPFLVSGWAGRERRGRWTVGPAATVVLAGAFDTSRDYRLRLSASPNLGRGRLERQLVTLAVNGHTVGEAELDSGGSRTLEFTIPPKAMEPDRLVIEIRVPGHVSPRELGISGDERSLGIYVSELVVE